MHSILIVEDESIVAEGLRYMARRSLPEFAVAGVASSGEQGLEMAAGSKPDIVLTDICMSGMDGLEMIARLQESGADCGYVLLSGYTEFAYAKRAMHLGVRYYLTKPVDERDLTEAIRSVDRDVTSEREQRKLLASLREQRQPVLLAKEEVPAEEEDIVSRIKAYIREHCSEEITLKEISGIFYLNPSYISQLFKQKTGSTYISYLTQVRMEKARQLLIETDMKIIDICEYVGYNDCTHFTRTFEKETGCRPNEYRLKLRTAGQQR